MQSYTKSLQASFSYAKQAFSRKLCYTKSQNFSILMSAQDVSQARLSRKPIIIHSSSFPMDSKRVIYEVERIPSSRLFDIDLISEKNTDLERTLPQPAEFIRHMKSLGINASDEVIAYDDNGIMGGTRALWMLNVYGNDNVKILDGGFEKWKAQRKPVENGEETWIDNYHRGGEGFELQKGFVANINEIRDFAYGISGDTELIDARPANIFKGETSGGGHIPKSKNIPSQMLLEEDKTFKKPEELKRIFEAHGVNLSKNIICSCYNGMSATVLYAALRLLGKTDVAVYDGSWQEWSKFPENETARKVDTTSQVPPQAFAMC